MRTRWTATLAILTLVAGLAACGGDDEPSATPNTSGEAGAALPAAELSLVAYSTPQEAYDKITEAFTKTPEGENITFTKSYGASGEQSRAVESGLTADIVAFSLEPDMNRLVKAGLVQTQAQGREKHYSFTPEPLQSVSKWIEAIETKWDERLLRLKTMVEEEGL